MKSTISFLLFASISLLWILWNRPQSETIIYSPQVIEEVSVFGDYEEGGVSQFHHWKMDPSGLLIEYQLQKKAESGVEYPYLGVRFQKVPNAQQDSCYNLPFYDSLVVDLDFLSEVNPPQGVSIQVVTKPPKRLKESERLLTYGANIKGSQFLVGIEQLKIPKWYQEKNKWTDSEPKELWLDRTCNIEILLPMKYHVLGQDYRVRIQSVKLVKSTRVYLISLSFMIGLLWLVGLMFLIRAKFFLKPLVQNLDDQFIAQIDESNSDSKANYLDPPNQAKSPSMLEQLEIATGYKKVELDSRDEEWWAEIQEIVNAEYMNPEFSTEKLAEEIGISQRKTSQIISSKMQTTLQNWVNEIRLTEGARLLKESNEQVVQIAYQVGYKNISHFNRQFKTKFNCTPSQYRQGTNIEPK